MGCEKLRNGDILAYTLDGIEIYLYSILLIETKQEGFDDVDVQSMQRGQILIAQDIKLDRLASRN